MGRPKGSKNKNKKIDIQFEKETKGKDTILTCTACSKKSKEDNFYMSRSVFYKGFKKFPVCKDCLDKEFDKLIKNLRYDMDMALYYMCMRLDIPFVISLLEGARSQANKLNTSIHRVYIQKINSMGLNNNYGQSFIDGDFIDFKGNLIAKDNGKPTNTIKNKPSLKSLNTNESFDEDVDVSNEIAAVNELVLSWGDFETDDLMFLESQYQQWVSRYEVSSMSMEILVKEICHQQLDIKKKRETGKPVDKELKTLQDLMGSTSLKPIQESTQASDAQALGTLIKKWENEKPIPEPSSEFKDVDGIKKYLRVWFFGHLCRMVGIDNDYSKEYDIETNKYTAVRPDSESMDIDSLDGDIDA